MAASASPTDRIFYDGDCGVCHASVRFVARRDPAGRAFRFAPLGGEVFSRTVPAEVSRSLPDTLVVQTADGEVLIRSRGVIHILRRLGPGWRFLGLLLGAVPRPIRDFGYDLFARGRRRLAARPQGVCPVLPPELAARFDP